MHWQFRHGLFLVGCLNSLAGGAGRVIDNDSDMRNPYIVAHASKCMRAGGVGGEVGATVRAVFHFVGGLMIANGAGSHLSLQ